MKTAFENILQNALDGMSGGPRHLADAISFYAKQEKFGKVSPEQELVRRLPKNPNDEARVLLKRHLTVWDYEPDAPWAAGTAPNTGERRKRIYELLQLSSKLRTILELYLPAYTGNTNILVDNPETSKDWYTFEFRRRQEFYWKRVRNYLSTIRSIPDESLASIDAATTQIMERLADPADESPRGARGLVVGYVQSGKTTNFTGLIAKALDAGYKLIIVLSGTTNLLRNQTQRRLDMDLVGRENILLGSDEEDIEHDYLDDPDWPAKFISYGKRPGRLGRVDLTRLTGAKDFEGRNAGFNPLEFEFEKKDRAAPLYRPENLNHAGARIIVAKKNADRLKQLDQDLKAVGKQKCAEIPALIIDDESDQASVNTRNPDKAAEKARTAINGYIVKILGRLVRCQYVGYTATPFANVFVNLNDPADLYPRDFMISLVRPTGYMGAREFHDFEIVAPGKLSNERAYVRGIPQDIKSTNDRLLEAIDAFVLSGAIKKFRELEGGASTFKHHTMLFHRSSSNEDQKAAVQAIRKLWKDAGYNSPGASAKRLAILLEDFRAVWLDRGKAAGLAFPKTYEELKPALGKALAEIRNGKPDGDPVLMVNSADGADVPDFDAKDGVWKIIVGGAKLSRGYTIEGLTISYFRRSTRMQDTLMQMGRWFGFRDGYQDLVRLYIGRQEPLGKHKTLDLYEAFEDMVRDEEDFRDQLSVYSREVGFTPKDIRALVFNSHPHLRPAARNKMYYAELAWAAFSYREPTGQSASIEGRKANSELFGGFLRQAKIKTEFVKPLDDSGSGFEVKWCGASQDEVLGILEHVSWTKAGSSIDAEIEYLKRHPRPVDSWLVMAPQVGDRAEGGVWRVGNEEFRCISRTRTDTRFNVFSTPDHLRFAKWLVGDDETDFQTKELKRKKRVGVLLLYPTREKNSDDNKIAASIPVMGFGLMLPAGAAQSRRIAFRTKAIRENARATSR